MNLKFLILVLYLWLLSECPKFPKNRQPDNDDKKSKNQYEKLQDQLFPFCPPVMIKMKKKESIPKIEKNIVILHYGLQRRLFVISLIV